MDAIPKSHKSIIDNTPKCHHCGKEYDLQKHHCMKGLSNRWKAEEDGLYINLCAECHAFLHGKDGHELDMEYKREAETAWLRHYRRDIPDWIRRYGKNFL